MRKVIVLGIMEMKLPSNSLTANLESFMRFTNSSLVLLFPPIVAITAEKTNHPLVEKEQGSACWDLILFNLSHSRDGISLDTRQIILRPQMRRNLLVGNWGVSFVSWDSWWFCKIKCTSAGFSHRNRASWHNLFILYPEESIPSINT